MRMYRTIPSMKKRLIEIIIDRSFKFTEKPTFILASGQKSNFYFNCKPTTLNAEGMYLIGNLLYDLIQSRKSWRVRAVGGLTLGADPVACALAHTSYLQGKPVEAFVVRKEPKKHGTMLWIEGNVHKGDSVLIIEDVITTGKSTLKAIDRAGRCGLRVKGVMVLIDRQEGGREMIEKKGIHVTSLLTKDEIFQEYRKQR